MKKRMMLLVLCAGLMAGCSSGGVSQEQYESVVAERDEYKAQLDNDAETQNISVEYDTLLDNLDNSVNKNISIEYSVIKINSVKDFESLPSGTLLYYVGNGGTGMYDLKSWAVLSSEIDADGNRVVLHCQPQGSFADEIYSSVDSILTYGNVYAFIKFDAIQVNEVDIEEQTSDTSSVPESSKPIELSTGKYIVGEDIPAGKYDIFGIDDGIISVCSEGKKYGDIVSEDIEAGKIVYSNVRLEDGYTVEVMLGGAVELQPK